MWLFLIQLFSLEYLQWQMSPKIIWIRALLFRNKIMNVFNNVQLRIEQSQRQRTFYCSILWSMIPRLCRDKRTNGSKFWTQFIVFDHSATTRQCSSMKFKDVARLCIAVVLSTLWIPGLGFPSAKKCKKAHHRLWDGSLGNFSSAAVTVDGEPCAQVGL